MHPFRGQILLNEIRRGYTFPDELFQQAIKAILYHHERWDGNGYPFGIKARRIPFIGRITAVCDAYEAITSVRPYNHRKPHEQACAELERCSGTQFDPEIVSMFLRNAAELKSNMQKFEKAVR